MGFRLLRLGLALAAGWLLPLNAPSATGTLTGANPSIRSLADLRVAAGKGDVFAQRVLGNAYLSGDGVQKDAAEGAHWVRAAANQRDPIAQYILGTLYDQGEGVTADLREAVKWYDLAAAQGLADAQYNLAICYSKGEGVLKDSKKAAEWFRKAAEQGDARSQCHLGLAYVTGNGVEKNSTEAASWLRKAAYQEDARAQFLLGRLYQLGEGVTQDLEIATKWVRKAALQNYMDAQFDFGRALLAGEGVERNPIEGRTWIEKAAAQGHALATQHLAQGARAALASSSPPPAPASEKSPRTQTSPPTPSRDNGFPAFPPSTSGLTAVAPAHEATHTLNPATAMREPLPFTPTLPPAGKPVELLPSKATGRPTAGDTTAKEPSLPPFTAPPTAKDAAPTTPAPDLFKLPSGGTDTNLNSLFTEPTRTREPQPQPQPRAREENTARSGNETNSGLMFIAAISTGISALILFLGVYVAVIFKTRLQGLESELKKAQFELSKANVNLSSMMHQVEQLALMAPAATPKTSLPEWNPEPAKAHTSSFKMNRSK